MFTGFQCVGYILYSEEFGQTDNCAQVNLYFISALMFSIWLIALLLPGSSFNIF